VEHACALQLWLVRGFGPAALQDESAAGAPVVVFVHVTVRVWIPPPQVTEQVPNAVVTQAYVTHAGQLPPQSTSVSVPFCTPSLQSGAAQVPPEQTRLVQSIPTLQPEPGSQGGHGPPQSGPVSPPFCWSSVQLGTVVVVVLVGVVVDVVVGSTTDAGAQRNFVDLISTGCVPNWSVSVLLGCAFGHFTL